MFNPLNVSDFFFLSLKLVTKGFTVVCFQILHLFLVLLLNPHSSDIEALEERKKNNLEIAVGWCKTWILENICPSLGRKSMNKSDKTGAVYFFPSLFHQSSHKTSKMRPKCRLLL